MPRTKPLVQNYLRANKSFPSVWCPGCGNGVILSSILRAIQSRGWDKNNIAMVSGIGCSGRMPVYADFNTLHTTHGRALAYATGLKLANPKLNVIVIMGDGDSMAIGGNHFIHTCRRNVSLTAIVINNRIYGMTGGQYSPTTPTAHRATTCTYGNIDQPFDVSSLAVAAGASFVGRSTVAHPRELEKIVNRALEKPGFAVVEAMSNCHTYYGRMNQVGKSVDMVKWFKENTVSHKVAPEKQEGKITRGIFVDKDLLGFIDFYAKLVEDSLIRKMELLESRKQRQEQ